MEELMKKMLEEMEAFVKVIENNFDGLHDYFEEQKKEFLDEFKGVHNSMASVGCKL